MDQMLSSLLIPARNSISPKPHDVICGRGGLSNNHVGNNEFRAAVLKSKRLYAKCPKYHKAAVARAIVLAVQNRIPQGRFIERKSEGKWVVVSMDKAIEKTSQALREKTRDEPNRVQSAEEIEEENKKIEAMLQSIGVSSKNAKCKDMKSKKNKLKVSNSKKVCPSPIDHKKPIDYKVCNSNNDSRESSKEESSCASDSKGDSDKEAEKGRKRKLDDSDLESSGKNPSRTTKIKEKVKKIFDLKSVNQRFPPPKITAKTGGRPLSVLTTENESQKDFFAQRLPARVTMSPSQFSQHQYLSEHQNHPTNFYPQNGYSTPQAPYTYDSGSSPWREVSCDSPLQYLGNVTPSHRPTVSMYRQTSASASYNYPSRAQHVQQAWGSHETNRYHHNNTQPSTPHMSNVHDIKYNTAGLDLHVITPTSIISRPSMDTNLLSRKSENPTDINDLFVPDFDHVTPPENFFRKDVSSRLGSISDVVTSDVCRSVEAGVNFTAQKIGSNNSIVTNMEPDMINPIPLRSTKTAIPPVEEDVNKFKNLFFPTKTDEELLNKNETSSGFDNVNINGFQGNIAPSTSLVSKTDIPVLCGIVESDKEDVMQESTQTTQPKFPSSYSTNCSRVVSISEESKVAASNEVGLMPFKNIDIDSDCSITSNNSFDFIPDLSTGEETNYGANLSSDDIDLLLNDHSPICVECDSL